MRTCVHARISNIPVYTLSRCMSCPRIIGTRRVCIMGLACTRRRRRAAPGPYTPEKEAREINRAVCMQEGGGAIGRASRRACDWIGGDGSPEIALTPRASPPPRRPVHVCACAPWNSTSRARVHARMCACVGVYYISRGPSRPQRPLQRAALHLPVARRPGLMHGVGVTARARPSAVLI